MQRPTGIEDALEIGDELPALRRRAIVHQHFGIAHDGRRRRAQFLAHIGNKRPLRSAVDTLVGLISRSTASRFNARAPMASAQATFATSKAAILPSRRDISPQEDPPHWWPQKLTPRGPPPLNSKSSIAR